MTGEQVNKILSTIIQTYQTETDPHKKALMGMEITRISRKLEQVGKKVS